jgi:hypothetical protein
VTDHPKKKPRKPPILRKGGKRPYQKGTREQIELRIQTVADLLAQHAKRTQVIRSIRELHKKEIEDKIAEPMWNLGWRQIDEYIARAREVLMADTNKTRAQARRESISFYENFISQGHGTPRDRIVAQERLDKVYGVEVHRIEMTGSAGGPIAIQDKTEVPKLSKQKLVALIALGESLTKSDEPVKSVA